MHYAFDLSNEVFAILDYTASRESGQMVVYAEDGHFEGDIALPFSQLGGSVRLKVTTLDQRDAGSATAQLIAVPDYRDPKGNSDAYARSFELEETPDGLRYSFYAPGVDFLMLKYRNKQQSALYPIFPENEEGYFCGEILLPLTYARTLTTVQLQNSRGTVKNGNEKQARKGYQAPPAPDRQEGRLSGVTVCIDPGHQENGHQVSEPIGPGLSGNTSGTSGMAQGTITLRKEAIVVLEIAMKLRDELLSQGATVVLTRDSQEGFKTNIERCQVAEEAGAQIMLRLHADLRTDTNSKRGFSVYGPLNSDYAKAVASKEDYRQMGQLLLDAMKTAVGYPLDKKYGAVTLNDQFVGNNWAKMTCFLVEMGYMSTPREDYLLSQPVYQQWLAEGMAQGVYEIALFRGWISREE